MKTCQGNTGRFLVQTGKACHPSSSFQLSCLLIQPDLVLYILLTQRPIGQGFMVVRSSRFGRFVFQLKFVSSPIFQPMFSCNVVRIPLSKNGAEEVKGKRSCRELSWKKRGNYVESCKNCWFPAVDVGPAGQAIHSYLSFNNVQVVQRLCFLIYQGMSIVAPPFSEDALAQEGRNCWSFPKGSNFADSTFVLPRSPRPAKSATARSVLNALAFSPRVKRSALRTAASSALLNGSDFRAVCLALQAPRCDFFLLLVEMYSVKVLSL